MATARAFTASAIASAEAEEAILADEHFMPEVGRARACGAKAAAESFQKAARAVRLTLMLEMNLAEIVRDIRAGQITYLGGVAVRKTVGEDLCASRETPCRGGWSENVPARALSDNSESDRRPLDISAEPRVELDRPDALSRAPFQETVEHICGDLNATVDWPAWRLMPAETTPYARHSPPPETNLDRRPPWRTPPTSARPPG